MNGTGFTVALFVGSAAIALWVCGRYPRLAPSSLSLRLAAVIGAAVALRLTGIDTSSSLRLFVSLFVITFPLLIAAWLTALWMLQTFRDLPGSGTR